jgi:hypothetical protein
MKLEINPRGNGACPLCANNGKCLLQTKFTEAVENVDKTEEIEIVIYTCPRFRERF